MRALFALCLIAILHFSLYPWQFEPAGLARPLIWLEIGSFSDYTDIAVNLAFYLIPALIGQWAFETPRHKLRILILIVGGLVLLSLTVEFLQLAIPGRFPTLRDVCCNGIGALIGAFLAFAIPNPARLLDQFKLPPQSSALTVLVIVWATWQTFPFLPYLRLHRLLAIPQLLLHPTWSLPEIADVFFALLTLYLLANHLRLGAFPITVAAALLIPAQALLRDVALSPARLLGAGIALLTAALFLQSPGRRHYLALAALITLWILDRQLVPCEFTSSPLNSFSWVPFRPLIEVGGRSASIRLLCGKFLIYTGALWLYCRTGLPLRLAASAVLTLVGLTESLQRFLPGRTPETTDLVLALLGTWTVALSAPTSGQASRLSTPSPPIVPHNQLPITPRPPQHRS